VASFTLLPLYPRYPLDRWLGGPQILSGGGGEEKNLQPQWESNPGVPIFQPVASRVVQLNTGTTSP
jgi:hypothetical protein